MIADSVTDIRTFEKLCLFSSPLTRFGQISILWEKDSVQTLLSLPLRQKLEVEMEYF